MARVILDPMFRSISGRLGDVIFKTIRGQTYMYAYPQPSKKTPAHAQVVQQARFARAVHAKAAEARFNPS